MRQYKIYWQVETWNTHLLGVSFSGFSWNSWLLSSKLVGLWKNMWSSYTSIPADSQPISRHIKLCPWLPADWRAVHNWVQLISTQIADSWSWELNNCYTKPPCFMWFISQQTLTDAPFRRGICSMCAEDQIESLLSGAVCMQSQHCHSLSWSP